MPATLQLHVELWRRRGGWFDRMERSVDAAVRLRYDVWSEELADRARGGAADAAWLASTRSQLALSRPIELALAGPRTRAAGRALLRGR